MNKVLVTGGTIMGTEQMNELEAIRIAIGIEENGYEFYTKASRKAMDERIEKLFQELARQEKSHAARFKKLYDEFLATSATSDEYIYDPEVSLYLEAIADATIIPSLDKIDSILERIKDPYDALNFALNIEKDSILYYSEMAIRAKNPNAKDAFTTLMKEERKHVLDIKRMLDTLNSQN